VSVVYVDSSALLKRVVVEAESTALRELLRETAGAGHLLTASSIAWLEVWRSLRRAAASDVAGLTDAAFSGVAEFPLTNGLVVRARRVGDDHLRSLDALHLASAIGVQADVMVTYDERLAAASRLVGMTVRSPT
jgi:predicted nucleic acid-binding protein